MTVTTTLLWLTLALPALAAVLVRWLSRAHATLAIAGALAGAVPALVLLVRVADGGRAHSTVSWLPAAHLDVGLRLDPLSAVMAALVAAIGLVVVVYATGYFADEPRAPTALAGLLAFLAAMQGLVLADGYLSLLIFWEIVGAASARLIAFNRDDVRAAPGAVRAFLTTRGADLGLYGAVLALWSSSGSLAFADSRPAGALGVLVGLGLVVAAMGKSAQAPLQTWLVGAMAGPTPVSALLHSATMVAAGVYLLARSYALLHGWPLEVAGWVGAVTALVGAGTALAQDDLKRVLAGSTASQLGLMFVGVAVGGPVVGIFHLVAHAVGKADMFLAAGVFQHERNGTELRLLRGAGRDDRAAFACFVAGALSIAAVPPMAAFWSKDHIAAATLHHVGWLIIVLVAAAGSAAYMARVVLVLWGVPGDAGKPVGELRGRSVMVGAAALLGLGSLGLGFVGGPLERLLGGTLPTSTSTLALSLLAVVLGVAGIVRIGGLRPSLVRAAASGLFADRVLGAVVQRPVLALATAADRADRRVIDPVVDGIGRAAVWTARVVELIERRGIDAAVDGLARQVGAGGDDLGRLQSGRLYEYLRDTVLGIAAVALLIAIAALT
jgi:NADH-quinone oxidoreductase subunit L